MRATELLLIKPCGGKQLHADLDQAELTITRALAMSGNAGHGCAQNTKGFVTARMARSSTDLDFTAHNRLHVLFTSSHQDWHHADKERVGKRLR